MDQPVRPRRPRNRLDLCGRVFGHLTAKERLPKLLGSQGERWLCACSCGRETVVRVKDLTHSNTRSCGHLTGRPRETADQPHRAALLYPEIMVAVHAALRGGLEVPRAELRAKYRDQLSHGTFYRFVAKAVDAWTPDTTNPAG
jgi:hypothetical protein